MVVVLHDIEFDKLYGKSYSHGMGNSKLKKKKQAAMTSTHRTKIKPILGPLEGKAYVIFRSHFKISDDDFLAA